MRKPLPHTAGEAARLIQGGRGQPSSLVGMVRKEPGEDAEAEAAQKAACPVSLGPMNKGLLPEALVTWCCKQPGCARQLSLACSQSRTCRRRRDRALDWRNETEGEGGCHSDGSWVEALSPQRHTKMGNWLHLWKLVHSPRMGA